MSAQILCHRHLRSISKCRGHLVVDFGPVGLIWSHIDAAKFEQFHGFLRARFPEMPDRSNLCVYRTLVIV